MWLEVSEKINKLQRTESNVKTYRNVIYGTQAVVALALVGGLVLRDFALIAFAGIPINCFIILTYVLGRRRFIILDRKVRTVTGSSSREDILLATRRVISTSLVILTFLVLNQIFFIAFAVLSTIGWKNFAPIGALNPVTVTAQLGVAMYLAFIAAINQYTLRSIALKVEKAKRDNLATPDTFKLRKGKQKKEDLPYFDESIVATL